jgi:hypothetical protein
MAEKKLPQGFINTQGKKSPFWKALEQWNGKNSSWCIPKKGSADYQDVLNIMQKHLKPKTKKKNEDLPPSGPKPAKSKSPAKGANERPKRNRKSPDFIIMNPKGKK